jgi:hypothetical protein
MIISWVAEYEHPDQQTLSEEEQPKQNRESNRETQRSSAVPLVYIYFTVQCANVSQVNESCFLGVTAGVFVCIFKFFINHCENCCVFFLCNYLSLL